jgi:glycosyltransferase involved in cell wall biosynthesis
LVETARNTGLEKAKGKYVMFVDGDDYIEDNSLGFLTDFVSQNDLDIGLFSLRLEGEENQKKKEVNAENIVSGIELYRHYRAKSVDSSCVMLIKLVLLKDHNIKYMVGIPFLEDGEFIARVMCVAERCSFFDYPYYIRIKRPGSATTTNLFHSKKAIDGFIKAAISLKQFKEDHPLSKEQKNFLNQPIVKFAVTAVSACQNRSTFKYLPYVRKRLFEDGLRKLDLKGCNKNHKPFGSAFNISPYYYFVWRLLSHPYISIKSKFGF